MNVAPPLHGFLSGGGELGRLIAAHDWASTSLGTIDRWGAPLRNTIGLILRSAVPLVTLWGEEGIMIYNDAYSQFAGGRHPRLLGSRVREGWPEVADFNDHIIKTVMGRGETLTYKAQPLVLARFGKPEEVWLDLDYSPLLDEDGTPIGVIAVVIEITDKIAADRARAAGQARLEQLFAQGPSFMALLGGPDQVFEFTNPAYQRLIGERMVIGKPIREALPEVAGQGYFEMLDDVLRSGEAMAHTAVPVLLQRVVGQAAEERWVDFVYQPIRDPDGAIGGIFVQGSDVTDRTRAERAAAEGARRFETFAQAMPTHVWSATPEGLLDWFNQRVFDYTGWSFELLAGDGWANAIDPDDIGDVARTWAAAIASGETYEAEFRIRRYDGDYRWHLVRALPIRDEAGRITRWIGTNTDIHERKLAETANARDRNRLWNSTQDLMLVADLDGIVTAINPSVTRTLGWSEAELIGGAVIDFVHSEDRERTRAEIRRLVDGVTTFAFENRFLAKDGSYRLLDWTAVADDGRLHGVARDITEERDLARDRDRAWTLSPGLKMVIDADGMVVNVDPSWTRVLGWSVAETIGRPVLDFVNDDNHDESVVRIATLVAGGTIASRMSRWTSKTGEPRWIEWTSVADAGNIYSFGRDVTAEHETAEALAVAEDALRQSQKMEAVGQLTGGIAHDFNNLLQGITGSLEVVQRRIGQGRTGDLDRFIQGATTAANRAAALTHRLLAFSRRQPLDPRPIRANALLASMEDLLRRTLGESVALELVLAGGLWLTLCDPNQLENAVLNLAINARDAMPDGGKLTIETCNAHLDSRYAAAHTDVKPGQYVCLCVTDTGGGMDGETMKRAFEPFFTTKPIGQGTGLGLSMIYGFARQSEGYAKIYSEIGKGTTVKLYLPRYRGDVEREEATPELDESHLADAGETVLVIEDEPVVRGLIVEVLSELGYSPLEAGDGPSGLAILESNRPIDLLITDIGLPGMNGRQVADAARARRPELRILFMTGYAENAALASGFLEPGMEMITKPFAIEALATRIRAMIAGG